MKYVKNNDIHFPLDRQSEKKQFYLIFQCIHACGNNLLANVTSVNDLKVKTLS